MKSIYVCLPVENVSLSTMFYEAIGFKKIPQFSDDTTSTMEWSETISFQLQSHDKFKGWVDKQIADAHQSAGVLLTLTMESRQGVDAIVNAAADAGGRAAAKAPIDLGWLYNRSFEDPNGNMFEAVWMDPNGAANM